jgi:hypothetical protein
MPNIVLWDERARELNYAPAPPDRIALLRDVYRVIITTSTRAAQAMDSLALATGAPSQILSLARQASPGHPDTDDTLNLGTLEPRLRHFTRPRSQPVPETGYLPAETETATPQAANPARNATTPEPRRGPLESRMRAANITDQATLLRAAAIDRAGDKLFNTAAKLAAKDMADGPTPEVPEPSPRRKSSPQTRRRTRATSPPRTNP